MTMTIYPRLAAAALIAMICGAAAQAGDGLTEVGIKGNDGIYAVHATTQLGTCDRDNNWLILVSGGRVRSAGDALFAASGQINPHGGVNLVFQGFGQVAKATGRVANGAGTGTWISPTMQCSGSWRATRRG
ncbi:MAG: hypothetical protein J2P49_06770 [Methylocapsa sp.]|nr:hypothetical protein [Methylocapsa sp.]